MPDETENTAVDGSSEPVADSAILLRLVDTLRGVPHADRGRYVKAAMVFLGSALDAYASPIEAARPAPSGPLDAAVAPSTFPRRVNIWMTQNALEESALEGAFHFGPSGVEVIAHTVPGKSNRERVRSCYLLAGLQSFLGTGEPRFADEDARAICRDLGCYDQANHSVHVKALGNLIAGSKSSSYELTQPGLKAAAELIRELHGPIR